MGKRIAMVTSCRFWLRNRGGLQRIATMTDSLVKHGHSISVYFVGKLQTDDYAMIQSQWPSIKACDHTIGASLSIDEKIQGFIKRTLFRHKWPREFPWNANRQACFDGQRTLADIYSEGQLDAFALFCKRVKPDAVIYQRLNNAYLAAGAGNALRIIDTHDVLHRRTESFHAVKEQHWIDVSRDEELAVLASMDYIMAIQARDAEYFKGVLPDKNIITVGHHVPIRNLPDRKKSNTVNIGFIAASGRANVHALEHFISSVFSKLPITFNIRLVIAGEICDFISELILPDNAEAIGRVNSLEEFYGQVDLVVNPAMIGGGLKIKNVEALCYGIMLITTPLGAEGIEHGAGDAFVVCNTDREWITALETYLPNAEARQRIAAAGQQLAKTTFMPDNVYAELFKVLED